MGRTRAGAWVLIILISGLSPRTTECALCHGMDGSGGLIRVVDEGGAVRSNPATFMVEGRQHVSVSSGRALFVFALPRGIVR